MAMLFHVDMIYLAEQAKWDVEKSFVLRWEPCSLISAFVIYFLESIIPRLATSEILIF